MDIVERLRGLPIVVTENGHTGMSRMGGALLSEAADEIERLREALKRIAAEPIHQCISRLSNPPVCDRAWIARSALQQKDSE